MCNSILATVLYGAPIWVCATKIRKSREMLRSTQRQMALRVCSAYCTVSDEALMVVAGQIPIHLLALERDRIFRRKTLETREATTLNLEERKKTIDTWQTE